MTCINNTNCLTFQCNMWDEEHNDGENYLNSEYGFSLENDGTCAVDEDPEPGKNCSMFEPIDDEDDDHE